MTKENEKQVPDNHALLKNTFARLNLSHNRRERKKFYITAYNSVYAATACSISPQAPPYLLAVALCDIIQSASIVYA